ENVHEGSPAVIRRGSPKRGELVKREQFAPLANENAGSLAQMGYFTTVKISGSRSTLVRSRTTGWKSGPTTWRLPGKSWFDHISDKSAEIEQAYADYRAGHFGPI